MLPETAPDTDASVDQTAADAEAAATSFVDNVTASASKAMDDLSALVVGNPVPAALTAAAVGAGLMALLALMSRSDPPYPRSSIPVGGTRLDYESLKQQIADIADRVGKALPTDAAKQNLDDATDALADTWSGVRDQALDVLGRLQPQATAAVKMARENPMWTAMIAGALGALLGSQLLGGKRTDDK